MNRILITGFSGFVSLHYLNFLDSLREKTQVVGVDISDPQFDIHTFNYLEIIYKKIDLLDLKQIE